MNKYLVEIDKYFSGPKQIIVEALSKKEALEEVVNNAHKYGVDGNYKMDTLRCVKKIHEKSTREGE